MSFCNIALLQISTIYNLCTDANLRNIRLTKHKNVNIHERFFINRWEKKAAPVVAADKNNSPCAMQIEAFLTLFILSLLNVYIYSLKNIHGLMRVGIHQPIKKTSRIIYAHFRCICVCVNTSTDIRLRVCMYFRV